MSRKKKPTKIKRDADQGRFHENLIIAYHKGEEPPRWFRETFFPGMLARLAVDLRLPPGSLDHLPHALHLHLTTAPAAQPKEARKDLEKIGSLLEQAREIVTRLRDSHLEGLRDPMDEGSKLLDDCLRWHNDIVVPRGRYGRRYSPGRRVLEKLLLQLKDDNPSLSLPQRVKLCKALFDPVLQQHDPDLPLPRWNELITEVEAATSEDPCSGKPV